MKRPIVLLISLLLTTAAFAQPRPGGPPPRDPERVAQTLGLSDSQRASWEAAHTEFRTATQPVLTRQRDLEKQLRTSLDAGNSEACTLGALVLQIHSLHEQLESAHQALDTKIESFLTAEQKARYESFRAGPGFGRPGPPPQN